MLQLARLRTVESSMTTRRCAAWQLTQENLCPLHLPEATAMQPKAAWL